MDKFLKDTRVAVTGGCGFIGSHLVDRLVRAGANVLVLKDEHDTCERLKEGARGITLTTCSFEKCGTLRDTLQAFSPKYVVHAKGLVTKESSPEAMEKLFDTNVRGTLHLLTALAEVPNVIRIVGLGSLEECAGGTAPFGENTPDAPTSPYALSKLLATNLLRYFFAHEKLPVVILRLAVVYGQRQRSGMLIPDLISSCLTHKDIPLTHGKQTRDFVFVDDVVEAILKSLVTPHLEGELIHIGSGSATRVRDIAETIHALTKSKGRLLFGALPERPGEAKAYVADIRKAQKLLGWEPGVTLTEGLQKTIMDYRTSLK